MPSDQNKRENNQQSGKEPRKNKQLDTKVTKSLGKSEDTQKVNQKSQSKKNRQCYGQKKQDKKKSNDQQKYCTKHLKIEQHEPH